VRYASLKKEETFEEKPARDSKKIILKERQAQADDPIYQQGIIGLGITQPKDLATESKTLGEDYKNDLKQFKTPSEMLQESMEIYKHL